MAKSKHDTAKSTAKRPKKAAGVPVTTTASAQSSAALSAKKVTKPVSVKG